MSDMRKLLESMTKFAGEPDQKSGDQVRGHEKATKQNPFKGRLVGGDASEGISEDDEDLEESLMQEYKYFVKEADPAPAPGQPTSPVANINPAATGTAATATPAGTPPAAGATTPPKPGTPAPAGATPAATTPPKPGAPAATTPPKPGTPAPSGTPPAAGATPPKPGAPAGGQAAGTATPPNPAQVKQQTDAITKVLNNPAHPINAELQALIKKAGSVPG